MHPDCIADLLAPYLDPANDQRLTANDLQRISIYIDLLQRWNARINLTAIRSEEEIVTRHFGESVFAARHLFPERRPEESGADASASISSMGEGSAAERRKSAAHDASRGYVTASEQAPEGRKKTLADIGSGAGFPGIPIKLWAPEISLTLIESNHKKAAFLKEVTRSLILTDVNIENTRAESLKGTTFNVVTLRAVERFESVLPIAASLLAPDGRLALLISSAQLPQARSALPSLTWFNPLEIPNSQARVLSVATKPIVSSEPHQ